MLRFSQRSCGGKAYPTLVCLLGVGNVVDTPGETPTAQKWKEEIKAAASLSGWDRVKEMYSFGESKNLGVELTACVQLSTCASIIGFIFGGVEKAKFAVAEYKERNQATIYRSTFEAQRGVQDYVVKQFLRGGLPSGIKMGSFMLCYSLLCSTMSCYRDRTSTLDFSVGGFITGAVFTLHRGLAGAVTGGTLGLLLGTLTGALTMGALKLTGVDLQEIRLWQYEQSIKRKKVEHKAMLKQREREDDESERVAFSILTDKERAEGRFVDRLENFAVEKKVEVIVPDLPPSSMLRTSGEKR